MALGGAEDRHARGRQRAGEEEDRLQGGADPLLRFDRRARAPGLHPGQPRLRDRRPARAGGRAPEGEQGPARQDPGDDRSRVRSGPPPDAPVQGRGGHLRHVHLAGGRFPLPRRRNAGSGNDRADLARRPGPGARGDAAPGRSAPDPGGDPEPRRRAGDRGRVRPLRDERARRARPGAGRRRSRPSSCSRSRANASPRASSRALSTTRAPRARSSRRTGRPPPERRRSRTRSRARSTRLR